jgi:hypothetical protein
VNAVLKQPKTALEMGGKRNGEVVDGVSCGRAVRQGGELLGFLFGGAVGLGWVGCM